MYKVTIEKIETEEYTERGSFCVIAEEGGEKKYGYAPSRTNEREVNRKVYEQTVKILDVYAVIQAVNDGGTGGLLAAPRIEMLKEGVDE